MKDKELAKNVIRDWIQDEHLPRFRMILGIDEICELMFLYHKAKTKREIEKAYKKGYAKGFEEGQIAEANYGKSEV